MNELNIYYLAAYAICYPIAFYKIVRWLEKEPGEPTSGRGCAAITLFFPIIFPMYFLCKFIDFTTFMLEKACRPFELAKTWCLEHPPIDVEDALF